MLRTVWAAVVSNAKIRTRHTLISLMILSVAFATVLTLCLYVRFERSYDSFHDARGVYRAESRLWEGGVATDVWATTSYGHGPAIAERIAGIDKMVRVTAQDREQVVGYNDIAYTESAYCYTEPAFFEVFNYPIVRGDAQKPLDRPGTVVVSQTAAARYFGTENPIGKRLTFRTARSEQHFEVSAVMADMPSNSNLKYDFLLSYSTIAPERRNIWYIHGVYTYLKLRPEVDPRTVENEFARISSEYRTKALEHKDWKIELVPLLDIHLEPQKPYEKQTKGNRTVLAVLSVMALAVLLISWVNFLNLTVVQSVSRAKEVLLRRMYGSGRGTVFLQVFCEVGAIHLAASCVAVGLFFVLRDALGGLIGVSIPFSWFGVGLLLVISAVGSVAISLYPAALLFRMPLAKIMRGNISTSRWANKLRQVLVGVQFVGSFVLVCGTLTVVAQLRYMQQQPLGIRTSHTLVARYPAFTQDMQAKEEGFRSELLGDKGIEGVSISGAVPGAEVANYFSVRRAGSDVRSAKLVQMLAVDRSFMEGYGIASAAGRIFSPEAAEDDQNVVVNETCARLLGFADPEAAVGQQVAIEVLGKPMSVVGVAKDYRQQAFSVESKPILFILKENMPMIATPYISIHFDPRSDPKTVLETVSARYAAYFPTTPFEYFFLDDFYGNQYRTEANFWRILVGAAAVALFISAVGLWVASLFSLAARRTQIQVRKIYGASRRSLFVWLVSEFFWVAALSSVCGAVVSYVLMSEWLSGYAASAGINGWIFVATALILLVVGVATISSRIHKAVSSRVRLR